MRPRGELRVSLSMAAADLPRFDGAGNRVGADFRSLAQASQVGSSELSYDVVRRTLRDMAVHGDLEVVGQTSLPGVCRPVNLYAVPLPEPDAADLVEVVRCWADFR